MTDARGEHSLQVPLYTVLPLEVVLAPDDRPLILTERREADGSRVLVRGDGRMERLISTDPQHYLSPSLHPGVLIP